MQSETIKILQIVAVGTILTLLVAGFMVSFVVAHRKRRNEFIREKKRMETEFERQLLQSQIEVQEHTFATLGKELHDNIGQLLSATKLLLGLTERHLNVIPDTLFTASNTLGQAISELRLLTKSLDKTWLEQFQLLENIKTEVERINTTGTIQAELLCANAPELENDKGIILFRIVQEAVQNALKHAGATKLTIQIEGKREATLVIVADNGKGFDPALKPGGIGLENMKQRTKLLGGSITIQSNQSGTCITLKIPKQNSLK